MKLLELLWWYTHTHTHPTNSSVTQLTVSQSVINYTDDFITIYLVWLNIKKNMMAIWTATQILPLFSMAAHHLSSRFIFVFFLVAVKKQESNHLVSILVFFSYHLSKCWPSNCSEISFALFTINFEELTGKLTFLLHINLTKPVVESIGWTFA